MHIDTDLRAKAFEAAMEINQEGHGDLDFVLADAKRIEAYLSGAQDADRLQAIIAQEEAQAEFDALMGAEPTTNAHGDSMPASGNVVSLTMGTAALREPEAKEAIATEPSQPKERKKPGRKPKAAKKAKATRKARAADTEAETVSAGETDAAPVANGSGEHIAAPVTEPQAEQPMAA